MTPSAIWAGKPPTAPPITGLPFHIASATPMANPSRTDFCSTMAAARWSALIWSWASGGSSSATISGSRAAASRSYASTSPLSGPSPPPPASTSRTSWCFFTIR